MKLLGLEFGIGLLCSMNSPPITYICVSGDNGEMHVPFFVLWVLAFFTALITKVILYGV